MYENCCGCELCSIVCPKKAIIMEVDQKGFIIPQIDKSLCVNCNLCQTICAFREKRKKTNAIIESYAAKNINEEIQLKSSSGGVFYEIAKFILEQDGVVYGAAYNIDKQMRVEHRRICKLEDLGVLLGSKYVQSSMQSIYSDVLFDLQEGKTVLFCGTPCQVDAIQTYIRLQHCTEGKMVTCDLVCHGVPSPMLWEEHIKLIEKKEHGYVKKYSFRYKSHKCKWGKINIQTTIVKDGREINRINTRLNKSFVSMYFGGLITRDCCEKCPYTQVSRVSDISLADCWGIEEIDSNFYDDKGVSLVLINSENGRNLFERVKKSFQVKKIDYTLLQQPHLYHNYMPSSKRDAFWELYNKNGFLKATKKYTDYGIICRINTCIHMLYGLLCTMLKTGRRMK